MNPSLRKAAVLISVLDTKTADDLLEQMGPEQAAVVRAAVMELDEIPTEEQQRVLQEFVHSQKPSRRTHASTDGVEVDESLLRRMTHRDHEVAANPSASQDPPRPLAWIAEIPTKTLVRQLTKERPQVIAVVMAHLPPTRAAEFLHRLRPDLQAEVAERLVYLDTMDSAIVEEVENALQRQLADELDFQRRRSTGLLTLETIVAAAPTGQREQLLRSLASRDESLAESLGVKILPEHGRQQGRHQQARHGHDAHGDTAADESLANSVPREPAGADRGAVEHRQAVESQARTGRTGRPTADFDFNSLLDLDDPSLTQLLRSMDAEIVLLALAGASHELMQRVVKRLSKFEAAQLQRQIAQSGPIRLRDVEEAQRRVAAEASRMIASGELAHPRRRATAA